MAEAPQITGQGAPQQSIVDILAGQPVGVFDCLRVEMQAEGTVSFNGIPVTLEQLTVAEQRARIRAASLVAPSE